MITVVVPSRYKIDRKKVRSQTSDFLLKKGVSPYKNINLVFIGRNKMRSVAKKYKKEAEALPVLSFAYTDKDDLLGEVFICYPQAVLLAAERNKRVDEIIDRLVKHGIENILK